MKTRFVLCSLVCAVAFGSVGCASYYKVTDPGSGKAYYTKSINKKRQGAISFKDQATKTDVTLNASEVMKITKDQYKANVP
jgi:hypothetical protein